MKDSPRRPMSGSRAWSTAKVAWAAGRTAARQLFARADPVTDTALGRTLVQELDAMKGLAMKVGQILSYLDVPLPGEVKTALVALQTGATAMEPDQVRAVIETAFGMPLQDVFDELELEPVAAASIGQVHRGRVGDQPVAVKVQYPAVADTMSSDISRLRRLSSLASLGTAVDGPSLVQELHDRIVEECDYLREGRFQRAFARAFAGLPQVRIPEVLVDRCRPRVLTTTWADGQSFEAFVASAAAGTRSAAGLTILRFAYQSLLVHAAIQADPHPGNYLFPPSDDGRDVVFLDFGCVRRLDLGMVEALRDLARSVLHADRHTFEDAAHRLGVVGDPERFDFESFWSDMRHLYLPFMTPRFRFDTRYVRAGYTSQGPRNPNARRMAIPPAFIWVLRLQWGAMSVMARLCAEADFRPVLAECLDAPITPLAAEGGP